MRASVTITGSLDGLLEEFTVQTAQRLTGVTAKAASTMRDEMRASIRSAGLGNLGRALDYNAYPGGGRASLHPAAEVFVRGKAPSAAKWEGIIDAFNEGATIKARNGGWIAIPTKNCPKGPRGRYLTPREVEARFGRMTMKAKGTKRLLFVDLVAGKSGGVRRATERRLAQGREAKEILVFVYVRQASINKRLDIDAIVKQWEARFPEMIANAVQER